MKGLLTTILILVFAMGAFAADGPVDKGSIILGGTAYFQSASGDLYKSGDDSQTWLGVMPEFGYFIAPSILIGLSVDFVSYSVGDYGTTDFGFGPMIGYYFNMDPARGEAKGAIYPYIKGFFNLNSHSVKDVDGSDKTTSIGGMGGINYMLSNAVALDFGVKFQSDSYKPDGADESTTGTVMFFGAGISAFIY